MEHWKDAELLYEEAVSGCYDLHYYSNPISKSHLQQFCRLIKRYISAETLVLDIGGGTGAVANRLVEYGYKKIVLIDLSLSMVRQAKRKLPGIVGLVCDGEHLPFYDNSIQAVICSSVLHHHPFPERILGDIKRVMESRAILISQEPNKNHFLLQKRFENLSNIIMGVMQYIYRVEKYRPISEPQIHEHHRAFTRQECVELFSSKFYVLEFYSKYPISCLFNKVKSSLISRYVCLLDKALHQYEGSTYYAVCSKDEMGYRNILKYYFQYLESVWAGSNERVPVKFLWLLLPLILAGRIYEIYQRMMMKFGKTLY